MSSEVVAAQFVVRTSDDHSWEQCVRYGGGQHDPNKDPRVLAAAERESA